MTRWAGLGVVELLLIAGLSGGGPVEPRKTEKAQVTPFATTAFADHFEKGKRANAIVSGDGQTYLGLYIFDRWGNCVAKDDTSGSSAGRDDLAVEWFPPEVASYTIEVCNFGRYANEFTIAIH